MFELIENWRVIQRMRQDMKELKTIQEKVQEIGCTLQKYMCENKQEFSRLSEVSEDVDVQFKNKIKNFCQPLFWWQSHDDLDDLIQSIVKRQKKKIIREIKDLEDNFNQLLKNSFDQFTLQREDRQLAQAPNEQISGALSDTLIRIQQVASLDLTQNKTSSEYFRGVLKRDFSRKKIDQGAVIFAVLQMVNVLVSLGNQLALTYAENFALQYKEYLKNTQNQLDELRRKIENYYRRFRPTKKKPSNRGFVLSFIGFLALLFALLFGLLVLI